MKRFKKSLFVVTAFFASFLLFSQNSENSFISAQPDSFLSEFVSRSWTASDGIPGNTVTDIIQSSKGYIYLGTYDGLVRFDGVEFVTFNRRTEKKFSFVSARTIFEDSNGNIWVGSNDEGVCKIFTSGQVQSFSTENGLPNNSVRSICEDKEENVWIGTTEGIAIINRAGTVEKFTGLEKYGQNNILVSKIFCDTAGRIWILSQKENEIYVCTNKIAERFDSLKSFKNPLISFVTQGKNGEFWFGVEPHYAVKVSGGEETVYDVGNGSQPGSTVRCIFQDKSGNMWFSRDTGVSILHSGVWSYMDLNTGLSDDNITKIIQDREGNIWFSTDRSGIEMFTPSKFKTTLMNTTVNAICEDASRSLVWLAADNGLYCLKNKKFTENALTQKCKNIRIRDVYVSDKGEVFVSCYEKPTFIVMEPNGNILSYDKSTGLAGNKARVAIKAKNGDIYVGTTSGLSIIKPNGKISSIKKEDGINNEFIMCIYQDKNDEVWCGTDGGGIFTLKDGKIEKRFTTEDGLCGNVIFKITQLGDNDYWITTGKGISRLSFEPSNESSNDSQKETCRFVNYSSIDGLGADGIFQTIVDYSGKVWMTSNRGIFSATMKELDAIKNGENIKVNAKFYGRNDGLISDGVTSTSKSMKDSNGSIWFTLVDGFSIYDPLNTTSNKTAPLVSIEQITIDNENLDWHGEKIILKPEVKRIEIKYTGLSFISSQQTQFRSKLKGFDDDFSLWSTKRNVSYTNLGPGKYDFYIMAANSDGVQSEKIEHIFIEKKPYFWEVIWFWVALAFVLVGIIFFFIRLRFLRMKRYQIQLEKTVKERTHELELEEAKSEGLLLNILPKDIANELKENPNKTIAKTCNNATVMFADIVGFTKMSDSMDSTEVVKLLNDIFTRFDNRALKEGVEKIKTIGDSYMAVTGLFNSSDSSDENKDALLKMMNFAHGLLQDLHDFNSTSKVKINMRIGINSGKIVAGVIGKSKFIYDIWGDTVNVASRMESNGQSGKICVTENVYNLLKNDFTFSEPIEINVKGKGVMKAYFTE